MVFLAIYLYSSAHGWTLLSNVSLLILIPLCILTAIDISKINPPVRQEEVSEESSSDTVIYKSVSKLYCQPDDIAYALCKDKHRLKWDMNLLSLSESQLGPKLDQSIDARYQSYTNREMNQAIEYTFYKEDNGLFYILEASVIDLFENECNYRLFEIKSSIDKTGKE